MKTFVCNSLAFFLACLATAAFAQDEALFGPQQKQNLGGILIVVNGGVDKPLADMADRFGTSFRAGAAVRYRKGQWQFGVKGDFIFGNTIREDSVLANIRNADGSFTGTSGQGVGIGIFERGYAVGLEAGRQLTLSKGATERSVLFLAGAGFMQHKIRVIDKDNAVPMLRRDYKKGYDRLTNGVYVEAFIGYQHFGKGGLLNFNIGPDLMAGFTKGRRDYLYDVMRKDDKARLDILLGLRGAICVPIHKRRGDDVYFE